MARVIYIESEIAGHERTRRILARFPHAVQVQCDRYGEVFNPKSQSFRLQKRDPALILARKHGHLVMPTPAGYGVGGRRNFYFSHMLNCVYDCRYCFLQGMYRSAHHVVFVNYEDFTAAIQERLDEAPDEDAWFFSGYDCDSLAYEPVTGFVEHILPEFAKRPRAWLELRTKSTQVRALTRHEAVDNVVVAFSFTPQQVSDLLEHGVPPVDRRIDAMARLQRAGWRIGVRFDPLIYNEAYREQYADLFQRIFSEVSGDAFHSITLGAFRLPPDYLKTMRRVYADEPLFSGPLQRNGGLMSYPPELEAEMLDYCGNLLSHHAQEPALFRHHSAF